MAETNKLISQETLLEEPRKLPEMINVLSILTFIGSGLAIIAQLYYFTAAKRLYDASMAGLEKLDQAPAWARNLQGPDPAGVIQRTYDNRFPICVLTLIAAVLCIIGAMQMRKLKKAGFYIYLIGELLPWITSFIFIGTIAFGGLGIIFGLLFTSVFIILYATQIKHLRK